MRKLVLTLLAVAATGLSAASRDPLVVSPEWLAKHLHDPDLVLLHVGDKDAYAAQHIPGAQLVMTADISVSDRSGKGLILEMPAADDLRQRLQKLGISDRSRVIVYYGKDWVSPSTRVLFTLDYAGLGDHSSLLDGGMQAWIAAGNEVTAEIPAPREGKLSPLKIRPLIVDATVVREDLGRKGFAVVDARNQSFYDGADTGGSPAGPHLTGHIAGAHSVPFANLTDDALHVRTAAELREVFTKAGVKPEDTVISYCHIGQQATAIVFAARILGQKALLYDGSFEDWSRQNGAVDNPSQKAAPPPQ